MSRVDLGVIHVVAPQCVVLTVFKLNRIGCFNFSMTYAIHFCYPFMRKKRKKEEKKKKKMVHMNKMVSIGIPIQNAKQKFYSLSLLLCFCWE